MKKCCFIIPYFGKLPNYFPLFLKTCQFNTNFDWLVFTDDRTEYDYPQNVQRIEMTFAELKQKIQSKFDFQISLSTPYKLCDYKPAYGYIFEEYLDSYKAWGHCDVDTLMGHLDDFITNQDLELYDKMFCLGHMVIYRNTIENNRLFMAKFNGRFLYKESFTTDKITVFDEEGISKGVNINRLFLEHGRRVYEVDHSLNINSNRFFFRRTVYKGNVEMVNRNGFEAEPYRKAVYLWENGFICRYYFYDGKLIKSNHPYIHLQSRCMSFNKDILCFPVVKIMPNSFSFLEFKEVTVENFSKIRKFDRNYVSYSRLFKEFVDNVKRNIFK